MVAAGFAGAVSYGTNAVWPLFCFSMAAFFPVMHSVIVTFPKYAASKSEASKALYKKLQMITVVMWMGYPLVWATCEGGRVGSVDQETIAYAALDIMAKCVFGFIMMSGHEGLEVTEDLALKSVATA
jgi:bacteriorhodopsin